MKTIEKQLINNLQQYENRTKICISIKIIKQKSLYVCLNTLILEPRSDLKTNVLFDFRAIINEDLRLFKT